MFLNDILLCIYIHKSKSDITESFRVSKQKYVSVNRDKT